MLYLQTKLQNSERGMVELEDTQRNTYYFCHLLERYKQRSVMKSLKTELDGWRCVFVCMVYV